MPTTNFTNTATGVTYSVTTGIFSDSVALTVPGQAAENFTGIPGGNIITATGGSATAVLGGGNYFIVPNVANSNFNILLNIAAATVVHVAGNVTIGTAVTALSSLTIDVDGGNATAGTLAGALGGVTVNLDNGGSFNTGAGLASILNGTTVNFGANGGTLVVNGGTSLINLSGTTINGFNAATSKIEFMGLTTPIDHYSITTSGSTQVVNLFSSTGTELGTFTVTGTSLPTGTVLAGQSGPLSFATVNGNLMIDPVASVLCFYEGTQISTPDGEKPVESLKIGDLVLTAAGKAVPVRWVGVNTVSTMFADLVQMLPVRIRAGALGDNMPCRDLLVSPDHAIFFDDVLVQAGALKNGMSVLQERNVPQTFKYYHVEVEGHEIIVADGTPVETFVDNVSRMNFDNWAEHVQLYGTNAPVPEMNYPRAKSMRQVPYSLRRELESRAMQFATYDDVAQAAA